MSTWDHSWPKKRSENIQKMYERALKDNDYALELAAGFLDDFSTFIWKTGDVNFSLLLSMLRTKVSNMRSMWQDKPKKHLARRIKKKPRKRA